MKTLIVGLIVLFIAAALAALASRDSGYVMITYGDWSVESSLVLLIIALLVLFLAVYFTIRFWSGLWALPRRMRLALGNRRSAKARRMTSQGLIALAEGRWRMAEKKLLGHAQRSDTPLLNYLGAARAAQEQGADERRDNYLRLAHENASSADIAVGLAQATLQADHRQWEQAVATLTHLRSLQPRHPQVLKMLAALHAQLLDWERLLEVVPALRRDNVLAAERINDMERSAYMGLLERATREQDPEQLRRVWQRIPGILRQDEDVLFNYVRYLIAMTADAGPEVEPLLYEGLRRKWSDPLAYLYGIVNGTEPAAQLERAEKWLKRQPKNPVLLLSLGRLCLQNNLWGKARSYLEASISIEPQPETYRELGKLMERLKEKNAALECYRKALTLVPDRALPSQEIAARARALPHTGGALPAETLPT